MGSKSSQIITYEKGMWNGRKRNKIGGHNFQVLGANFLLGVTKVLLEPNSFTGACAGSSDGGGEICC